MDKIKIGGIMQSDGRTLLRLLSMPDEPGARAAAVSALGERGVNIELMVESPGNRGRGHLSLVIGQNDAGNALGIMEEVMLKIGARAVEHLGEVAVISIFGPHLREKPLVPGRMFSALAKAKVGSLAVSTSISSLSCVVRAVDLDLALEALNRVFDAPFQVAKRPKEY